DLGRQDHGYTYKVKSLLRRASMQTNEFDLFAAGDFYEAGGGLKSYWVARWLGGQNQCTNVPPSVAFVHPSSTLSYLPGSQFNLSAIAYGAGGADISGVAFYEDGQSLWSGAQDPFNASVYYVDWDSPWTGGIHRFDAVATDTN